MRDGKLTHSPRKRFGQNFLQDQTIISRIITTIRPQLQDVVVEIGPGLGALTAPLLKACGRLQVIELDRDVIAPLEAACAGLGELTVHQGDVLKFDFKRLATDDTALRVVGNLPYNISTPLLFHLFEQLSVIKDMHFMLQKEVVVRMAAKPSTKAYGRLSVMVQYYCEVEHLFDVPPEAFNPPPKVNSSIVWLKPHAHRPLNATQEAMLETVVREAFNQRRKTLNNSLKALIQGKDLQQMGIDPNQRAENVSVSDYVKLAQALSDPA